MGEHDIDIIKAFAAALHQQEHEPVEDMTGDPDNIVCAGDVEMAEAIIEDIERLGFTIVRKPRP